MTRVLIGCLASILLLATGIQAQQAKHSFAFSDTAFLLDGKPFQIISGELHYPRVPKEAWRQRMRMAKAMGLNTIGTYIFWNLHEPQRGQFNFTGNNDVAQFVRMAQEEGLWVILRPSPYVCAEWEFGGYPYWLQKEKDLVVRSKDPKYLAEYKKYIDAVGKQLAPYQINHGGNILMVQIENEYGSYGSDKEYLDINRKMFIDAGFDGLLYTCDPAPDLVKGQLPGILPAVNGLDKPEAVKKIVRENNSGKGPFFIAEWYPAWFDWWGEAHHTVPAEKYTPALDAILGAGISINMYMFHGGSTRGFMNGANRKDDTPYEPQISSYDYDAPLDEAGNPTHKFMEFRKVIEKHLPAGQVLPPVPAAKPAIAIPAIQLTQTKYLVLPKGVASNRPLTFEDLGQDYGYVLYRTQLNNAASGMLNIDSLCDYAVVYVNGTKVGTMDRRSFRDSMFLSLPKGAVTLDILVENMGRINFGKYMLHNRKGITHGVYLNGKELTGWQMFSLPFTDVEQLPLTEKKQTNGLVLKKGSFHVDKVGDTYLDMRQWGKGVVWINGNNLGRYWSIGPQQTLYVPVEWLKKGKNEIVVLDLLKPDQSTIQALDKPVLNQLQPEGEGAKK
jgi:beta-galactosidase